MKSLRRICSIILVLLFVIQVPCNALYTSADGTKAKDATVNVETVAENKEYFEGCDP